MRPRRGICDECGGGCGDVRSRRCQRCERAQAAKYGRDVELTGGRWVPADGIMRWQPDGVVA